MITAKNYTAQVTKELAVLASTPFPDIGNDGGKQKLKSVLNGMNKSIVFSLPDNGIVFDDNYKGIEGDRINLPYPSICIEFDYVQGPYRIACVIYAVEAEDEITVYSFTKNGSVFIPNPYSQTILKQWDTHKEEDSFMSAKPTLCFGLGLYNDEERVAKDPGLKAELDQQMKESQMWILPVLELVEALSCENVYTEPIQKVDPSVNRKRINKGKVPLFETRVLCIKAVGIRSVKGNGDGTHKSPRMHLRRGHIRRLPTGKKTFVQSCVVRGASNGIINKSYTVQKN